MKRPRVVKIGRDPYCATGPKCHRFLKRNTARRMRRYVRSHPEDNGKVKYYGYAT
jgi:hypothetical protein